MNRSKTDDIFEIPFEIPASKIKICLIGYAGFMYDIATALKDANLQVSCIATHVDEAKETDDMVVALVRRGLYYSMAKTADFAEAKLLRFSDLNSEKAIEKIGKTGANVVISCSAPVLGRYFIESFQGKTFNFHGSSTYRGRGGGSWAILNDCQRDAVVLHWMNIGIDTGGKIAEAPFEWAKDAYPIDHMVAQRPCFGTLTKKFSEHLKSGSIPCFPQDTSRPYFPTLYTHIDGDVDWCNPPDAIEKVVRAFGWPYQGAGAVIEHANRTNRTNVRIARARVRANAGTTGFHAKSNGCIIARSKGGSVSVACGGGILDVETLRHGVDEMAAADTIRVGMRFVKATRE